MGFSSNISGLLKFGAMPPSRPGKWVI